MTAIFKQDGKWRVRDARLGIDAEFETHAKAQMIANEISAYKLLQMQGAEKEWLDRSMNMILDNVANLAVVYQVYGISPGTGAGIKWTEPQ